MTSLGRHLKGKAKVKHKIKRVDELLRNEQLMQEQEGVYDVVASTLLSGLQEILLLVDWSSCESHEQHILKATLVLRGRSVTLYEEVHPEKNLGKLKVHRKFLQRLKEKIPVGCHVVVETDAGFRTEWFELVLEMGWDFIGRVRSNLLFQLAGSKEWESCLSLYSKATKQAKYVGDVLLGKKRSLECALYLYHEKKAKKGKKVKRKIASGKMEKSYSRANKEPWLLATSLGGKSKKANSIIYRYRQRMRIEHEFRDTKDVQWGIGLAYSRTKDIERLQLLLLIGHLAMFVLWITGLAAEQKKMHYGYQANTIRTHRVLSLVYLGLQINLHDPGSISELDVINTFNEVRKSCI